MFNLTESFWRHPMTFVGCLALQICMLTLSNAMLIMIIIYEKHGMDPKKRCIPNQLISYLCKLAIFSNTSIMPVLMFRILAMPLDEAASGWAYVSLVFVALNLMLGLTEIICYQCINAYAGNKMALVDDDLASLWLTAVNMFVGMAIGMLRYFSVEHDSNEFFAYLKGTTSLAQNGSIQMFVSRVPMLSCIAIIAMSCFVMCAMKVKTMWQSRNLTYPEGAAPAVPQYNNQVKNDVIISIGSTLVIIGSLVLLAVPFVLCRYFKLLDEAEVITIFFCAYGLLVHLFPFAFFACEPKSFRLALDALK